MTTKKAYSLFEEMRSVAENILTDFTLNHSLSTNKKADKSLVTGCDKEIDKKLSEIAEKFGLSVISEEGNHLLKRVKSGNYLTIDPIDGTLGYIDYVNYALKNNRINKFLQKDLGSKHDFCLLIGIVENNFARFGYCYNYVTKEEIFIDGKNKKNFIRRFNKRDYNQEFAAYLDIRGIDKIKETIKKIPNATVIQQATVGLKSLYTILNPHKAAVMPHTEQKSGLWDILPAAAAAVVFGGKIYDDRGSLLKLNEYIAIPGNGVLVIKGDKFKFVRNLIKNKINRVKKHSQHETSYS